jgi:2-iminobutanoate/2-iminopropanoate deaminase
MTSSTRRSFTARLAALFSLSAAAAVPAAAAKNDTSIRKLNDEGRPADGTQMITPLIVHNGMIYVSGQGANDMGPVEQQDIETHTRKVMANIKTLVELGGGTVDSILQLNVYLAHIEHYDRMNKVFKTFFPNGGPARTTFGVAGLPGRSLVEINCIAAVTRK